MQLVKFTYKPLWPGSTCRPTNGDRYSSFRDFFFFFFSFSLDAYSNGRAFFLTRASCNFRRETHTRRPLHALSFSLVNVCKCMRRASRFNFQWDASFISCQGSDFIDVNGNARTFVIGSLKNRGMYDSKKREKLHHSRSLLFPVAVVLRMRFCKKKKKEKFIKNRFLVITFEYHCLESGKTVLTMKLRSE